MPPIEEHKDRCLHPELWVEMRGDIRDIKKDIALTKDELEKVALYTGMDPMNNGDSLRGQITGLAGEFHCALTKQNKLAAIIATIVIMLIIGSIYVTKSNIDRNEKSNLRTESQVENIAAKVTKLIEAANLVKP